MRMTVGSVAVVALMWMLIVVFSPPEFAQPNGPAQLVAEQDAEEKADKEGEAASEEAKQEASEEKPQAADSQRVRVVRLGETPRRARIREKLQEPTELDFFDQPLERAVQFIEGLHEFKIIVNEVSLSEEGVDLSEPVNLQLKDVSLESALDLMLGRLGLGYRICDGYLYIESQFELEQHFEVRLYDMAQLSSHGEAKQLIQVVQDSTSGAWEAEDGEGGTISHYDGMLVVRQTQATHDEIEELLNGMRAVFAQREATQGDPRPEQVSGLGNNWQPSTGVK